MHTSKLGAVWFHAAALVWFSGPLLYMMSGTLMVWFRDGEKNLLRLLLPGVGEGGEGTVQGINGHHDNLLLKRL